MCETVFKVCFAHFPIKNFRAHTIVVGIYINVEFERLKNLMIHGHIHAISAGVMRFACDGTALLKLRGMAPTLHQPINK